MNFERIADRYPEEREAIARLRELLGAPATSSREYTLSWLCDLVHPTSPEGLAVILGELVRRGFLRQVVRVVSPTTQGGIGDYASLSEVPQFVHDWRSDTEFEVRPGDLRVLYIASEPGPDDGPSRA